ncbi:hypothetical protein ACFZ9I_31270 [Pseudomonas aeruginosa]|uniref:hypothetical protein n=2 Tax=Pseudomonas aeruginosa TaxID=287 RepID=UPI0000F2F274|nr:hypothetical protein PA2G_05832 [Pseudomonas aeruginosa 2192]MBG4253253.1 hypothetical protein [Pseudomonas aeruginosa]MBG7325717.1 hypothetical protein [Pseudomonas aeruginosa]MBG7386507.1 hypothetical protein [Pseudomonas aeruginosa]
MIKNDSQGPSCTCPSGDGSLVHPCPAHPAVEQVGGDERAAFEAAYQTEHAGFMGPLKLERREDGEYKSEHVGSAWRMWQARAALAQPSPAQTQPSPAPTLRAAIDVANDRFEVPVAKWGTNPVGEEERPEVVAYFDRNYPSTGDAFIWSNYEGSPYEPVMTVAQHDRIVGALRAKADQLREALEWRKENQAGQRELLRSVTAERDAALARVAEFEAQSQHSAGYAEARQCVNCRHIGINDAADYAACHDCRWTGPEPDEDKCPGCAGENCMAAACPECGGRYELVAEANIATPVAQGGQVPQAWLDVQAERRRQITAEGWTPEHDDLYCAAELPRAAAAYILNGANDEAPAIWPFVAKWWKPRDARSNYVRASALILAEIERLDRAAATQGGPRDA